MIDEPALDHGIGSAFHAVGGYGMGKAVPTVPTHLRGERDLVATDDAEFFRILTLGIFGAEGDVVFALGLQTAGDLAGLAVQLQAGGQTLGGKLHRPFAGSGTGVQKRRTGTDAKDIRTIDARCGGFRRGQNVRSHGGGGFGGNRHGGGTGGFKLGVGPVGMVEIDAVAAVGHFQHEGFHPGQIHGDLLRGVALVQDTALPECFAVAFDDEFHAAQAIAHFVIHAHGRGKTGAAAGQIELQMAVGVGAETMVERFAADGQFVAVHRDIFVRFAIPLRGEADVQTVQPDGVGGCRSDGE